MLNITDFVIIVAAILVAKNIQRVVNKITEEFFD